MGANSGKLRGVKKENPINTWAIQEALGAGSYGKVTKVRNRSTGALAAAKVAPIQVQEELDNFATEIEILTSCQHKNITNFVDAFYNNNELWILIEICDAGSLSGYIDKAEKGLSEDLIQPIMHQMLKGIRFLHGCGVIHRDINASNTLLTSGGIVKLADFGVSAFNKQDGAKRSTFVGSPHWMAPEVIACEHDKKARYNSLCDVWSLGITAIELAQCQPPYHDLHPVKVLFKITAAPSPKLDQPEQWSNDFHSFLSAALIKDPMRRPTAAQLLSQPFCMDKTDTFQLAQLAHSSRLPRS
eukprot:m.19947 g.19947  ORF g.19947 m.19947 type:complete len:300 (-) comp8780_c0_seq1:435-1334(-)